MDAFIATHCILDQAMNFKSDRVIPQNNLINFIGDSISTLHIEHSLVQVAFILPKVRHVRQAVPGEDIFSIKNIVDLTLSIVNKAHQLKYLTDRFYVLLVALRKFVWCALQ